MKRRVVGIVAAVVLAVVGTVALVAYVQSAKDRAVADEELVEVYVVESRVAKGTPVADLGSSVGVAEVPGRLLADDVVTDLDSLDDEFVAAVDLLPGDQVVTSRFVNEANLRTVSVPDGLQEVTVPLDPARGVGGGLQAGDTVGVVLSFDPFSIDEATGEPGASDANTEEDGGEPSKTPNMTHLTFHKVLVTRVQFDAEEEGGSGSGSSDDDEDDEADVDTAPSRQLLVTLALDGPAVEQVVFAAEFGHIWLTAENADADESGTRIVTLDEAYEPTRAG